MFTSIADRIVLGIEEIEVEIENCLLNMSKGIPDGVSLARALKNLEDLKKEIYGKYCKASGGNTETIGG